jgi:carboxypeptidase Q
MGALIAVGFLWTSAALSADWTEQDLATAATLRDRAMQGTSAYEHVESLVTEVGPRLAGSAGDAAAVRWAMERLAKLGFSNVRTQDVLVPRWVRGSSEVTLLGPAPQTLVATPLGGSISTDEHGIEAQVVRVESYDALLALDESAVANKIVFIDYRMERRRDGSDYSNAVRGRTLGASAAAKLGASAIVIRSIGTSDDRVAHTGAVRYTLDAPRIPAFALAHPDADILARRVQAGKAVRLRVKSTSRELPPAWSANVIGEIPGRERPQEIVLIGAHLDSWDEGHGALDDGAGIAIAMEAARLIGRLDRKPARTIRVVLFADEEFGFSGAREYAKQIGDEAQRHIVAMEADIGQGLSGVSARACRKRRCRRSQPCMKSSSRWMWNPGITPRRAAPTSVRCANWEYRFWICRSTRLCISTCITRRTTRFTRSTRRS